tara:strand:+ start:1627 stop:1839 length:213 start_codon:yes stop_codon:yes gene_type:complete
MVDNTQTQMKKKLLQAARQEFLLRLQKTCIKIGAEFEFVASSEGHASLAPPPTPVPASDFFRAKRHAKQV